MKTYFLAACALIAVISEKDMIVDTIAEIAPKTAERISVTIDEGDTAGRFDLNRPESSTFLIGLNNFTSSPIFGSYFRLKTNYGPYKGHYPHNIFIELLMTLGIIGLLFFLYLLLISYRNCQRELFVSRDSKIFPFMILFLASFLMLQTSKSLLLREDFWFSFYILCSYNIMKIRYISLQR